MIEIIGVGGYSEIGKNCTAVRVDNEVVIFDLGLDMDKYIRFTEDEDISDVKVKDLIDFGAVPDLKKIKKWLPEVKAIVCSHVHLDHIGAIPFLGDQIDAPVIGTPFTIELIKTICKDDKIRLKNRLIPMNINSKMQLSENITLEFINVTHSTLQTVIVALKTKYGYILYANDFKFDNYPTIGQKPNYKRLEEISKEGVLALFVDSIYSSFEGKTPSEQVAQDMLRDVLLSSGSNEAILVTTFASHIARLKSIVKMGRELNRKVLFVGRSLAKYVGAAKKLKLIDFSDVEIIKYARKIKNKLESIDDFSKYLVVCTGHQGEPKAVLCKIAAGTYKMHLGENDKVIFSCKTIPSGINEKNREKLEKKLKKKKVRLFKDIHVSGHCSKEDIRDLLLLVKPQNVIPSHVDKVKAAGTVELCREMKIKNVHVLKDGKKLKIKSKL
jgi:ribonuclease J